MKILAQHGFGPKDKLAEGLRRGIIGGAILSPRYLSPDRMTTQVTNIRDAGGRVLIDPEFYGAEFESHPDPKLGCLEEWDYFEQPRRRDLISGRAVPGLIERALADQLQMGVSDWIAPNVYVREADSIDTAVALHFVSQAKVESAKLGDLPVFATLALHRDAILDGDEFRGIVDALTAIDEPPDGYYVIVGSNEQGGSGKQVRSDLYQPQVIAGWMYLNYVLAINGARVINGYAHLLSPLLGACGAEATASGWFSGLRKFCIDRYRQQQSGGRFPRVRYVSTSLMSNILHTDYLDYCGVAIEVANDRPLDTPYNDGEPTRTEAALQSWEALDSLAQYFCTDGVKDGLDRLDTHLDRAKELWNRLSDHGFSNEIEPHRERVGAMRDGIRMFREWAELA